AGRSQAGDQLRVVQRMLLQDMDAAGEQLPRQLGPATAVEAAVEHHAGDVDRGQLLGTGVERDVVVTGAGSGAVTAPSQDSTEVERHAAPPECRQVYPSEPGAAYHNARPPTRLRCHRRTPLVSGVAVSSHDSPQLRSR